jgi:hypothetical protein
MKIKRTKPQKQADPKQAPKPWRNVLPIHPACEAIPPILSAELKDLAEDIKENGLQVPITIDKPPNGKLSLLDGRSRLDAMELAGIPFQLVTAGRNGLALKVERPGFPPLSSPKGPSSLCAQRQFASPPSHHRAEAQADRQGDRKRPI